MTPRAKQLGLALIVVLVILGIIFMRNREGTTAAFREGYDSTANSPARTP